MRIGLVYAAMGCDGASGERDTNSNLLFCWPLMHSSVFAQHFTFQNVFSHSVVQALRIVAALFHCCASMFFDAKVIAEWSIRATSAASAFSDSDDGCMRVVVEVFLGRPR